MLFINPDDDIYNALLLVISSRSAIKNRNRINKINEPYNISIITLNSRDSFLNSFIIVSLSYRKLIIQFINIRGILLILRSWASLLWDILSNTPDISRLSRVATRFGPGRPQIMYICSVISCRAVSTDLPFWAPIYISGRRLLVSASPVILRAITSSSSLPMVLRSVIGLQAFNTVQSLLFGFLRISVIAFFYFLG